MKKNYRNVDKNIWRVKYIHEHNAYGKNIAEYVKVGTFPQ